MPGAERHLPTLSDHDSRLYIRDEAGGLLIGCFEPKGKAIHPSRLGADFAFQLLPEDWDQIVMRGDMAAQKFTAFYLRDRLVIGANAVNSPRELRFARMLMEQGARPDPASLADPNIPLKSLLVG